MSIQITITDSLLESLKRHAIPFTDTTPLSVIERWARHFDEHPDAQQSKIAVPVPLPSTNSEGMKFDAIRPPDLFHTRVRGTFGETPFGQWIDLLQTAHIEAFKKAKSFEELRSATAAQIRNGSHSDSGYHFIPAIGISLQGTDANHAWKYALRLAQYVKAPITATVEWRHNDKAQYPGKTGILHWIP